MRNGVLWDHAEPTAGPRGPETAASNRCCCYVEKLSTSGPAPRRGLRVPLAPPRQLGRDPSKWYERPTEDASQTCRDCKLRAGLLGALSEETRYDVIPV